MQLAGQWRVGTQRGLKQQHSDWGGRRGHGAAQACARVRPRHRGAQRDGQCSPSSGLLRRRNWGPESTGAQWGHVSTGQGSRSPGIPWTLQSQAHPPQSFHLPYGARRPFSPESDSKTPVPINMFSSTNVTGQLWARVSVPGVTEFSDPLSLFGGK